MPILSRFPDPRAPPPRATSTFALGQYNSASPTTRRDGIQPAGEALVTDFPFSLMLSLYCSAAVPARAIFRLLLMQQFRRLPHNASGAYPSSLAVAPRFENCPAIQPCQMPVPLSHVDDRRMDVAIAIDEIHRAVANRNKAFVFHGVVALRVMQHLGGLLAELRLLIKNVGAIHAYNGKNSFLKNLGEPLFGGSAHDFCQQNIACI